MKIRVCLFFHGLIRDYSSRENLTTATTITTKMRKKGEEEREIHPQLLLPFRKAKVFPNIKVRS